ncbi:hypothetical protein [Nocardiopsis oceani]
MSWPDDPGPNPENTPPETAPPEGGRRPAPDGSGPGTAADDAPLTQEDALHALRREAVSSREQAESARMSAITDHLLDRLQKQPEGLKIGTLALFNDSVRFGGGFHTSAHGSGPVGGGPAARGSTELPPDWINQHVDNYVRPPDFDRLLGILCRDRLLILARPDGSGREATAVNLLAEAVALSTGGQGRLVRLGEGEPLADPGWKPGGKGQGLLALLDNAAGAHRRTAPERTIDSEWVHRVRSTLDTCDSYLLLVTGPPQGALLETAAQTESVATGDSGIDPVDIVRRWALGESTGAEQDRQLTERLGEVGALDLLAQNPAPRTAVKLASAVREGRDLRELVSRLSDPSARVHQWFARHREPAQISFALAAAVLHDARYLAVSDAAVTLYNLLTEEHAAPPALRFQETLHTTPWIVLAEPEEGRGHPRVRFREPRMQQAVVAYAWNHLDGQRTALVRWLRQLATHRDVEVQARACVATAVAVAQDMDHALHRFLDDWAGHRSAQARRAAATVLGVVSEDPDSTERVWNLLYTWADRPGTVTERRMAATSALIAGGPPGRRDPEAAAEVLFAALGEDDSWDSLTHVAEAMTSLAGHGRTGHVLAALLDWSHDQDASPLVLKSLLAFCYVAGASTVPDPGEPTGPPRRRGRPKTVPLLLDASDRHLHLLAELWKRALARKPVQEVALDVLREWVEQADTVPGGRKALLQLLRGVADGGQRHRERLRYWLGQWAANRGGGSETAAECLHGI